VITFFPALCEPEGQETMARRKHDRSRRSASNKDKNMKALYARMRQKFTVADLQKYTEVEEGIPAEKVLAEMEELYRKHAAKKG
jgi:hypothetical protein